MTSPRRILVIEPDASSRRAHAGWLHAEGYEVETARSGREALGVLERDDASFDLVLASIAASRAGAALVEQLVAARPEVPVIAIAGDNRASVAAIERGAVHCLLHPVDQEPLRRITAHVLNRPPRRAARDRGAPPRPSAAVVSATDAKNEFAAVLETAVARGPVTITKHDAPRAVLVAREEFDALVGRSNDRISALTGAFDELLDRMQAPGVRARMQAAFDASPDELGEAAVRAARR